MAMWALYFGCVYHFLIFCAKIQNNSDDLRHYQIIYDVIKAGDWRMEEGIFHNMRKGVQ
jgi:hypothetical protein